MNKYTYWKLKRENPELLNKKTREKNARRMSRIRKDPLRYAHWREVNNRKIKRHISKHPIEYRYNLYLNSAKGRGIEFRLSIEQFKQFWQKPCHYCKDKIETIGLDRVDNDKGYLINNVVSCCVTCNWMKRNLSKDIFIDHCRKVAGGL